MTVSVPSTTFGIPVFASSLSDFHGTRFLGNCIAGIPLLILANKIDLINHTSKKFNDELNRTKKELFKYFDFEEIRSRDWQFLFTSVKTNFNINHITKSLFHLARPEKTIL